MIQDSEHQEIIQIEMAAKGCVSGTLAEWPHLNSALRKRGYKLNKTTTALELRELCRTILRGIGRLKP